MKTKFAILFWVSLIFVPCAAFGELVKKNIEYKDGDTVLEGVLVYDSAATGKLPGILVAHEWWGLTDHAKNIADTLAGMGYAAFALDMYGKGVTTQDPQEAKRLCGVVRGKPVQRSRALAGLKVLSEQPNVDPKKIAAVGFCFGGAVVLDLAYSGADLKGVVCVHGGIVLPKPEELSQIKSKILVLHGAEDSFTPEDQILAFKKAMIQSGADWQLTFFGGAAHSFTNPNAGNDKSKGMAYNETATRHAWGQMVTFFGENL